ncbi:MAG: tetratricopeptide repeat protein [Immundisolibacterales bacterium]|nr:tetratricopeptide repeat protein [Immundisolibacterales bacterium]
MPEPALASNIGLYRSGVTSPERLRRTTVARGHLLDNTVESLRGSVRRKSKNHLLFIGPRGIGKTHLLSCIEDTVLSDKTLGERIVVARFPEESNRTLSFADFLIGLCEILSDVLEDEPRWAKLFAEVQTEEDDARVKDTLVPAIREENRRHGRTLLVMLENLGEVLSRQIRDGKDVAALRKFLMADNGCLLVATAPVHFDGITDVRQPFYDFFDIQMLESLSFEETVEVIRSNLEWEERTGILATLEDMRPRLEALYRMTGGNPRLTMMLYELIAHESITGVQEQFHLLLDRVSPFYQGRLNDLPPGQRALLECLASMRGEEKTPAAIAARMRTSQQETSSLLKRLSDAHYLRSERHPRDRRSRLYMIREGFFDIWLAMNLSRGARKRLPFLLEFFSLFYPDIAARNEKRLHLRAKLLEEGITDVESALDYLSEVGDQGERASAKLDMARTFARLGETEQVASYVLEAAPLAGDGVSRSIARIVSSTPSAPNYLSEIEEMIAAWEKHRSGELEAFAHHLAEMGKGLTLRTFSETRLAFLRDALESVDKAEERIALRLRIAAVLMDLARWEECEEQQRQALAEAIVGPSSTLVARASGELAQLLQCTNRLEEAEPLTRRALEIDETVLGKQHPAVARDLNILAILLLETGRIAEAEQLLRRALDIDSTTFERHHPTIARDLNNLATLLLDTNRIEEAEPLLRRALEIDVAALGDQDPTVATSLGNLATLVQRTGRFEEAESLMRRALDVDLAALGEHHPTVALRSNNLATLLLETGRIEEAEQLLRRALDISVAALGEQHPTVAIELNNLASLLQDSDRIEEAEPLLRRALEVDVAALGEKHPNAAIRLNNLATLLLDTNRRREAVPLLRQSLEIFRAVLQQTGHEHPCFRSAKENYLLLQHSTEPDEPS